MSSPPDSSLPAPAPAPDADYIVIRVNREWLEAVKGRIKVLGTVLLMCGGGTTWSSIQSLFAVWSTQDTMVSTQEAARETSVALAAESAERSEHQERFKRALSVLPDDLDERCQQQGYVRP